MARIEFDEELAKFHPCLELDDVQDIIEGQDLDDVADILVAMIRDQEDARNAAASGRKKRQ